jgi:sugar phosphate isomerase/epimerase
MELKLGFFSGAVPTWDPAETAAATAEAGFAGIEWEMRSEEGHISLETAAKDADARHRESQAAGLDVPCVSAHPALSLLDGPSVRALVEAARICDATLARMFAPAFDPSRRVDEQLETVHGALAGHADGYSEHGVTLVIELSEETILPSPELLRRACDGIDPMAVGALYDPANMLVEGNIAPPFALAILGDYLHHVHIKNEAFVSSNGRWAPEIVRADEGLVDWRVVFAELRRVGYSGWVVIDHLSDDASLERMALERAVAEGFWEGEGA